MNETAKNIIKYVSLALAIMLCVSIVMPFSCYFALFTCSMAFDDSSVDCRKEFGALTGFTEVPPCETAIYQNTHGGFHGDGSTAMVMTFDEENGALLSSLLAETENWRPAPMYGRVSDLFYSNGFFSAAEITDGYYSCYDKQQESFDPEVFDTKEYSTNCWIAAYDCDDPTLYFYEHDT